MKPLDVKEVEGYINNLESVDLVGKLKLEGNVIFGIVKIELENLEGSLDFEIIIYPFYPLRNSDTESIKFINRDLIEFSHVMEDGMICIHTSHCIDVKKKIEIDFNSLKNWILKYYLNKEIDDHYEHIIVPENLIEGVYYKYIFSEIDYDFNIGQFGNVKLSTLKNGFHKGKPITNYILQDVCIDNNETVAFEWSSYYEGLHKSQEGLFYFLGRAPAKNKKFAFKNWLEFEPYLSNDFLDFLHRFEKLNLKTNKNKLVPIFIGYNISDEEIHWECLLLKLGCFPLEGKPLIYNGRKTGTWETQITSYEIQWANTINSSFKYFYGRGTFCEQLINSNILVIGVGAIGSMVAKTFVQCGVTKINIVDFDIKLPENVCRSEYQFANGVSSKTEELKQILHGISPHVDVNILQDFQFDLAMKVGSRNKFSKENLKKVFDEFDLIVDCSTDDDLMFMLDSLKLKTELINISISNHAKEMVCGFSPNSYHFVKTQFSSLIQNNVDDLYNPNGCWSPTFKANYNDINVLVQFAMKQINRIYSGEVLKKNFVLKTEDEGSFNIKLEEY